MTSLLLFLALWAGAEEAADVKFVEGFIKTPVERLDPSTIDRYMAIKPDALPKKLQLKYQARRVELQTLKQLAGDKKKGLIRMPEKECTVPSEAKSDQPAALAMGGFEEITDEEEQYILDKTQCTERDLLCESSLQIVVVRDAKTNKVKKRRYFLYPGDPLMALVGASRGGKNIGGNTSFFSRPTLLCSH